MSSITAKELHLQTKAILDQLERGESLVVTRHGRAVARMEPISNGGELKWDDVMSEVWKAQKIVSESERSPNPVLQERERRRR